MFGSGKSSRVFIKRLNQIRHIKETLQDIYRLIREAPVRENQLISLSRQNIDLRLQIKKIHHSKINVVFILWRPQMWESLRSVYEAFNNDENFCVYIVVVPIRDVESAESYSSTGAEEFWKQYSAINGYDYETGKWFLLEDLKPDYVFFQQPYDGLHPVAYQSQTVGMYSKICYVPYGMQVVGKDILDIVYPSAFLKYTSFLFCLDKYSVTSIARQLTEQGIATQVEICGSTRFDALKQYQNTESDSWPHEHEGRFRILWTPRWSTNEGTCTFFENKASLLDWVHENKDVDLVFRPHPEMHREMISTGEFSEEEWNRMQVDFSSDPQLTMETLPEYFPTFFSSDCLVTDITSLMVEYIMTGHPLIYCHKKNYFTKLGEYISQGFYIVHNQQELIDTLQKIKDGYDPLKDTRRQIIESLRPHGTPAGENIKNVILADALK